MITVKDLSNNKEYRGRSVDTVARRVWGRRVTAEKVTGVEGQYEILEQPTKRLRDKGLTASLIVTTVYVYES